MELSGKALFDSKMNEIYVVKEVKQHFYREFTSKVMTQEISIVQLVSDNKYAIIPKLQISLKYLLLLIVTKKINIVEGYSSIAYSRLKRNHKS